MKDYKLSELKRICKNTGSCKLCRIKELCSRLEHCALSELDIDEDETPDMDLTTLEVLDLAK